MSEETKQQRTEKFLQLRAELRHAWTRVKKEGWATMAPVIRKLQAALRRKTP